MKSFNRTSLPESISYNGHQYLLNTDISGAMNANNTAPSTIAATLKAEGRKCILVNVLSKNLRGKNDLHGRPYQPSKWIYATN